MEIPKIPNNFSLTDLKILLLHFSNFLPSTYLNHIFEIRFDVYIVHSYKFLL